MRAFMIVILVVAVVAIAGYLLGWYTVSTVSHDDRTTVSVTIDKEKWHTDKNEFRTQAESRLKDMDKKIGELQTKMMQLPTEARDSLTRTIDKLHQQDQAVRDELANPPASTRERWDTAKTRLEQALGDLEHGVQNAWSRFRDN